MTDNPDDYSTAALLPALLAQRVRADECEEELRQVRSAHADRLAGFRKRLLEMAEEMATS